MLVIDTLKPLGKTPRNRFSAGPALVPLLALLLCALPLAAQSRSAAPPAVDSASEASPLTDPAPGPSVDTSAVSSPVGSPLRGDSIPPGSLVQIHLSRSLNSATVHNGEEVPGVLQTPVRTSSGKTLPVGTAVTATIIATTPAGTMSSAGQLTLQLVRVGNIAVFSDIMERDGQPGARDIPDGLPARGTEATIASGTPLRFSIPRLPGA